MSIEAEIVVTLAEVEVTDDYRVAIALRERVTVLDLSQAEQLAAELVDAVAEAQKAAAEDFPPVRPGEVHAFDIAPTCRECTEGKHGACTGIAVVDGDEVEEHPCGCSRVDHLVIGRFS